MRNIHLCRTIPLVPLLTAMMLFVSACSETGDSAAPDDTRAVNGDAVALSAVMADLGDTVWQLVRFQGGDDTLVEAEDKTRYTLVFGADGELAARVYCNRGRGVWTSDGRNQIQFGPMALTRAMCPPDDLHDRLLKHWEWFRSYTMRDGHLFLALMADGGIYEFEPAPAQPD